MDGLMEGGRGESIGGGRPGHGEGEKRCQRARECRGRQERRERYRRKERGSEGGGEKGTMSQPCVINAKKVGARLRLRGVIMMDLRTEESFSSRAPSLVDAEGACTRPRSDRAMAWGRRVNKNALCQLEKAYLLP
eukprot:451222-Rhodomonas_salina.2